MGIDLPSFKVLVYTWGITFGGYEYARCFVFVATRFYARGAGERRDASTHAGVLTARLSDEARTPNALLCTARIMWTWTIYELINKKTNQYL